MPVALEEHHPGGEEGVGRERLELESPASSKKIVLIPQISDAASVLPASAAVGR